MLVMPSFGQSRPLKRRKSMDCGIKIERNVPTFEEAMKRYKKIVAETSSPPLSKEEKGTIKRACLNGDSIVLRCTFEDKTL